jgi:hypothetical protein
MNKARELMREIETAHDEVMRESRMMATADPESVERYAARLRTFYRALDQLYRYTNELEMEIQFGPTVRT